MAKQPYILVIGPGSGTLELMLGSALAEASRGVEIDLDKVYAPFCKMYPSGEAGKLVGVDQSTITLYHVIPPQMFVDILEESRINETQPIKAYDVNKEYVRLLRQTTQKLSNQHVLTEATLTDYLEVHYGALKPSKYPTLPADRIDYQAEILANVMSAPDLSKIVRDLGSPTAVIASNVTFPATESVWLGNRADYYARITELASGAPVILRDTHPELIIVMHNMLEEHNQAAKRALPLSFEREFDSTNKFPIALNPHLGTKLGDMETTLNTVLQAAGSSYSAQIRTYEPHFSVLTILSP